MRVLAIADIHGVVSVYKWLVGLASEEQVDLVVLAGDLFGSGGEEQHREQARKIIGLLKKAPVPLFYLMGNDDFVHLDYEDERIKPIHGRRLMWGGYGFAGYQYSLPFVGGIFEKPEEEIQEDLKSLSELLDARTVLVTHSPAYGELDQVWDHSHVGSRSLAALLERKPVLAHIHGHIHECFGRDENHFNVAAAGQRRAVLIDLPSLDSKVLQAV